MYFSCICLFIVHAFISLPLGVWLTETSDCGTLWTFLLTFVQDLEFDCVRSISFLLNLPCTNLTLCAADVPNAHNCFLTKRFSNSNWYLYCRWPKLYLGKLDRIFHVLCRGNTVP